MVSEELMARLQEEEFEVKILYYKIAGNYLYYLNKRKWCPSNIHSLRNYLNKEIRSRVFQDINSEIIRLSFCLIRYLAKS